MKKTLCRGIYKITNVVNNKCYIGSAVDIDRRFSRHIDDLEKNRHHSAALQRAWNKYGKNNFIFEMLENILNKSALIDREQYYLDNLRPEYNICPHAGSSLGRPCKEENKKKISDKLKGRKFSEETKRKISQALSGKKKEAEHVEKMRQSLMGRDAWNKNETKETNNSVQNISKALKERFKNKKNHPNYGKHHSKETKQKISNARKNTAGSKAKLTKEQVVEILNTHNKNKLLTCKDLAALVNSDIATVWRIINKKAYKYIKFEE